MILPIHICKPHKKPADNQGGNDENRKEESN